MTTADRPGTRRRNSSGLRRDLDILQACARAGGEGLGVAAVATATGRDKSAVSRSMATLAEAGLLSRDPHTRAYRPGWQVYALAARTGEAGLATAARQYVRRAAAASGETAHLSVLRGGRVLTVLTEFSGHQFHTARWEGAVAPAWQTPSGRVLLSDWSADALAAWFDRYGPDAATDAHRQSPHHPEPPSRTPSTPEQAAARLEQVRRTGYALSDEEFEIGVVAASAPVRDFTGRIIAALNVSAPKARFTGPLAELGRSVAPIALALSMHLGATADLVTSSTPSPADTQPAGSHDSAADTRWATGSFDAASLAVSDRVAKDK